MAVSKKIKQKVLENNLCTIRGPYCTKIATTVDHIVPKAKGGKNYRSNLTPACFECNQWKGKDSIIKGPGIKGTIKEPYTPQEKHDLMVELAKYLSPDTKDEDV